MRQIHRKDFMFYRRSYQQVQARISSVQKSPDIIDIWQEQKNIREEEARLEREYELAKARVKELRIRLKQNGGLLTDLEDLQTTFSDKFSRYFHNTRLWTTKSAKKFLLKIKIIYLKARFRLGVPVRKRGSFRLEKLVTVALIVIGVFVVMQGKDAGSSTNTADNPSSSSSGLPLVQQPEFAVLSPRGQGPAGQRGYARVNPPHSAATYTFIDRVDGVTVRVSQQKLSEKPQQNELAKIAKDFNATRQLDGSTAAAFVNDYKDGRQFLITYKEGLLLLISSDAGIDDQSWINYINELSLSS